MCKQIYSIIAMFLLILTLILMIPAMPVQATTEEYYGEAYLDLTTDEQRTAYHLVEEGIAGLSPRIEFEGKVTIYYRDLLDIVHAVCVDHPQYFWFLETGVYYYDKVYEGNLVSAFEPQYMLDGEVVSCGSQELMDAIIAFHTKINEIVNGIPQNYTTDFQIALYLHDYLAEHITYSLEGEHPSAYAALIHGQAACYGYSKAYQCLLNAAGLRARTITGACYDEKGQLVGHAWNQVWLDNKCYYVDVTWDDFEEVTMHAAFALTLAEFSKDHFPDEEFHLPDCTHKEMNYYALCCGLGVAYVPLSYDHTDVRLISHFRMEGYTEEGLVFSCEFKYEGYGINSFLTQSYGDPDFHSLFFGVSESARYDMYDSCYLRYVILKDESSQHIYLSSIEGITLQEEAIQLPGAGTQYVLSPQVASSEGWIPLPIFESSDPTVATVSQQGMITAVSEGTAVITVRNYDGTISDSCTVTVRPQQAHVHTLRLFTAKQALCLQDGHMDYYLCTECGHRFADAAGKMEYDNAAAFVLPATGHVDLSPVKQLDYHTMKCKCGEVMKDTREKHFDHDGNQFCDVCNSPMGNKTTQKGNNESSPKTDIWILGGVVIVVAAVVFLIIFRRRRQR